MLSCIIELHRVSKFAFQFNTS